MTKSEFVAEMIQERKFYWLPFLRSTVKVIEGNSRLSLHDRRELLRKTAASIRKFETELVDLEREKAAVITGGLN